jgi:hypothetical protein
MDRREFIGVVGGAALWPLPLAAQHGDRARRILRTGLSTCYWSPLDWLSASRLLPPRSGLERSDFVHWHSWRIGRDRGQAGRVMLDVSLSRRDPN